MAEALPMGAQEAGGGGAALVGKLRMAEHGMVEVRWGGRLTGCLRAAARVSD